MRVTLSHKNDILNELHAALSKRPSDAFRVKAAIFLSKLYDSWYDKNIKGYETHPLFKLLSKQSDVCIKSDRPDHIIALRIPATARNNNGHTLQNIPHRADTNRLHFNGNLQGNRWDAARCILRLTQEQAEEYDKLKAESAEISRGINKKVTAVETVLNSVRTYNQLQKNAPAIFEILPTAIQQQLHQEVEKKRVVKARRVAGKPEIDVGITDEIMEGVSQSLCVEKLLDDKD